MNAEEELAPWLALSQIKGLGSVSCKKLAAHFGDPTRAFFASPAELSEIEGLQRQAVAALTGFSQWDRAASAVRRIHDAGVALVRFTDEDYPARLRAIADPPPLLYVKGKLTKADDKAVAIVGSRSASNYGKRVARDLARGLASYGFTVISGMARGIDGMAHESALAGGGRTIAVLGSGVERAYPPEHGELYNRIAASGAVLSELPLGTKPMAFNFPARNRLISGMALGVVVVEATEKSGSLITAALAVEQGREVFAVPGEVGSSRARGAHKLIREGARLVENVNDIIEEIAPQLMRQSAAAKSVVPASLPENSRPAARKIYSLVQENALQVDEVIEQSGLNAAEVLEILLDLELQGYLRQLPGKVYTAER